MESALLALLVGVVGGIFGAATQHAFKRYAESGQTRREIVETHLLQLQNSVESLYYRMNNLQHWGDRGKYLQIWRRENGEWRIAVDIFNSDLVPQP